MYTWFCFGYWQVDVYIRNEIQLNLSSGFHLSSICINAKQNLCYTCTKYQSEVYKENYNYVPVTYMFTHVFLYLATSAITCTVYICVFRVLIGLSLPKSFVTGQSLVLWHPIENHSLEIWRQLPRNVLIRLSDIMRYSN